MRSLLILMALLALSAAPRSVLAAPPAAPAQPVQANNIEAEYKLGANDKLRVTVFGEDSLSGEYLVSPSGEMALPLIGVVTAQGKTVAELKKAIEDKYRDGYLRDPNVSIEVESFRPYFILGEVNKPGEYPFIADLTVAKAVATAGGYTYRANQKRVFIRHAGEETAKEYPLDSALPVSPGDEVRITERYF